jgi:hypothetical protein
MTQVEHERPRAQGAQDAVCLGVERGAADDQELGIEIALDATRQTAALNDASTDREAGWFSGRSGPFAESGPDAARRVDDSQFPHVGLRALRALNGLAHRHEHVPFIQRHPCLKGAESDRVAGLKLSASGTTGLTSYPRVATLSIFPPFDRNVKPEVKDGLLREFGGVI